MNYLYPFRAITPTNTTVSSFNKLFSACAQSNNSIENYENKIKNINSLLEVNLFSQKTKNFYCCRITNKSFVITGLIALINTNLLDKKIFRHEKCIDRKKNLYKDLFNKYNAQISPVTLVHENNAKINKSLNLISKETKPFLEFSDNKNRYEFWSISNYNYYQELYNNIDAFMIADGHHRISSLSPNNDLIVAFLIPANQAKSADILREYYKVTPLYKKKLSNFLSNDLNLTKTNLIINHKVSNNFLCKIDKDIYELNRNQNEEIKEILEYLDQFINYENDELNFYNSPYDKNNNLVYCKKEIGLLIPALDCIHNIKNPPLYPPHSSLFYPKIPDGLISYSRNV